MNPLEAVDPAELISRSSAKWRTHRSGVLPLWVAEMDVRLAEPVERALTDAIRRGDTGYATGAGYAEAFARFAAARWGWRGVDPARTALAPDVMLGIVEVLRLVTGRGDTVVLSAPVYPPFFAFVEHDGRRILPSRLDGRGRLDLESLEEVFAAARARSRRVAYLLCNPHNPTGAVHTRAELEAVAALAQWYGVRVVADEIHGPLVPAGAAFTPYLSVAGAEDAFAVTSASKGWNLAGLKAALIVAGPDAAADLRRLPEEVGHGPSHLGVIGHTAALDHGGAWLDGLLDGLAANRELLGRLLTEHLPEIGYQPPQGTYLAWLDCRPLGLHDPDADGVAGIVTEVAGPARFFLDHADVALSSGHVFGAGGAGFVRLNFATSQRMLTEAISRMGRAWRRVRDAA
ncbi:aminotransferase class I/II-fold pyridoxal phosphate-dependent enzyme [Actinoplanes missouriensis]|uniref:MalY/PatB family protein n=1 Tax=Actinoplanes missouriensis TaxID=1866 RepID=UPI0033CB296C